MKGKETQTSFEITYSARITEEDQQIFCNPQMEKE